MVKLAGKSIRQGSGFNGAKCTAVKVQFVPVHEVSLALASLDKSTRYLHVDVLNLDYVVSPNHRCLLTIYR